MSSVDKLEIGNGISYFYRNTYITAKRNNGIDICLFIDNTGVYHSNIDRTNNTIKHNIYIDEVTDGLRVTDFIGAPPSQGYGRLASNTTFQILKANYPGTTVITGRLFNPSGALSDHERRVRFWESCGFEVEDPNSFDSRIVSTVDRLKVVPLLNGNCKNSIGVPYLIPLNEFRPISDLSKKRDDEELKLFPMAELESSISRITPSRSVYDFDLKAAKRDNQLFLMIVCLFCFVGFCLRLAEQRPLFKY